MGAVAAWVCLPKLRASHPARGADARLGCNQLASTLTVRGAAAGLIALMFLQL